MGSRLECKAHSTPLGKVDKDLDCEERKHDDVVVKNQDAARIAADLHIMNKPQLRSPKVELENQNRAPVTEEAIQIARITADLKLLEKKKKSKPAKGRQAVNLAVECNSSLEFEPRQRIPVSEQDVQAARVAADLNLVKKMKSSALGRHSKFVRSASEPR